MIQWFMARSLLSRIFIGTTVALFTALVTVGILYRAEIQKAAKQALEIAAYKQTIFQKDATITQLRAQVVKEREIASRWRTRANERETAAVEADKRVSTILEENHEALEWWNTSVPGPLVGELRREANHGGETHPPGTSGRVSGTDPDPGNDGGFQWRFIPFGPGKKGGH